MSRFLSICIAALLIASAKTNAEQYTATNITWASSREQAMSMVESTGKKLIFLEVGSTSCGGCMALHNETVYVTDPPINQILSKYFVCWFGLYTDTDWQPYMTFDFPMPNTCFIDTVTDKGLDHRIAIRRSYEAPQLYARMLAIINDYVANYSINPTSTNLGLAQSTGTIAIAASEYCSWGASCTSDWVRITSATNGFGTGTLTYAVAAYTGTATRTGTIEVARQTFIIKQSPRSDDSAWLLSLVPIITHHQQHHPRSRT